jgi:hypothetical protein
MRVGQDARRARMARRLAELGSRALHATMDVVLEVV